MQVTPGLNVVGVHFGRKATSQCVADRVQVRPLGQFQLNRGDRPDARFGVDHAPKFLQLIQTHEGKRAVVFAHPGFIQIDDRELLVHDLGFIRRVGKHHADVIAGLGVVVIDHVAVGVSSADAAGGNAQNDSRELFVHGIHRRDQFALGRCTDQLLGVTGAERRPGGGVFGNRLLLSGLSVLGLSVLAGPQFRHQPTFLGHHFFDRAILGHPLLAVHPAGRFQSLAVRGVPRFTQLERGRFLVFRVHQVFAEITDAVVTFGIQSDQVDVSSDLLPAELDPQH